ncbi:hypothetical protein [Qipengyuania soli]|uniref:Uncharacterized protein n=1 Tax=Qipengyuania soli TaxID=2782568 RepID=A0A7S8IV82_9SPHN|nr:hypothetical protein [Qipengyuania soli]QPC98521.1 hypothetical protein IRL76_11825 [Qipengyuania soli]
MADETHESGATEARIAQLEARLTEIDQTGKRGGMVDRVMRYLPLLALGNAFVAAPAMIISVAVAYFAFEQAEATKKMQIAEVWPRVTYSTSNMDEEGESDIKLALLNKGVGPAIVRGMQVSYKGKSYVDFRSILADCCSGDAQNLSIGIGTVNGEVIRPGEEMMFAVLPRSEQNSEAWERFNSERFQLEIATCYCSVFDACWVDDGTSNEPLEVKQCPVEWTQYTGFPQSAGNGS